MMEVALVIFIVYRKVTRISNLPLNVLISSILRRKNNIRIWCQPQSRPLFRIVPGPKGHCYVLIVHRIEANLWTETNLYFSRLFPVRGTIRIKSHISVLKVGNDVRALVINDGSVRNPRSRGYLRITLQPDRTDISIRFSIPFETDISPGLSQNSIKSSKPCHHIDFIHTFDLQLHINSRLARIRCVSGIKRQCCRVIACSNIRYYSLLPILLSFIYPTISISLILGRN